MIHRHAVLAMILFMMTGALWAQERQFQRNALRGLQGGLKAAGAPALTPEQEEQLRTLLAEFRQSHRTDSPRTALAEARQAYADAILGSDHDAAQL